LPLGISSFTALVTSLLKLNVEDENHSLVIYLVRLFVALLLAYNYARALKTYVRVLITLSLTVASISIGFVFALFVFEHLTDPTSASLEQIIPLAPLFQTIDEFRTVWGPGMPPIEYSFPTLATLCFLILFYRTTSIGSVRATTLLVGLGLSFAWLASVVASETCIEGGHLCELYLSVYKYIFTLRPGHIGYPLGPVLLVGLTVLVGGWLVALCSQYERLAFAIVTSGCGAVSLCLLGIIFSNQMILSIPFELLMAVGLVCQVGYILFQQELVVATNTK